MPKNYIDLRIVLSYDKDTDDPEIRYLHDAKIKVSRVKGLTGAEVSIVAEHFGQSDNYQLMLVNDSIAAISEKGEEMEDAEWVARKGAMLRPLPSGFDTPSTFNP